MASTFLFAMVMMLMVTNTMCEMSAKSKNKVNTGLNGGQKAVDFLSKLGDPKTSRMFDALGKMSSFLGAAGGLVSFALAFVPKADSPELRYMKLKFAEVNTKLDRITTELDNVKSLITFENQRSVYVGSASKILYGHKRLFEFLNELQSTTCGDEKNCKRVRSRIASRYVADFNVEQYLFMILHGAVKPTSAFGDPLLDLIKKTFKCDVGKIDHLVNSILKLSFKAQQVILAHEKLIGSKFSITQSMDNWLKSLYTLRESAYKTKQHCFHHMATHMIADINDKKYQVGVSSNDHANQEVKKFMEEKYKWLGWVAYSYGAYGGSKHCVTNVYGKFWNMPGDKNARKRNLIVSLTDKSGTYDNQKYLVLKALDEIVANTDFKSRRKPDACKLLPKVTEELKKEGVWKYVTSLSVLREYSDLVIRADNDLTYISEEYIFKSGKTNGRVLEDKVRLVIVLKSMEEANGVTCDKQCENQGSCTRRPYSSAKYCHCKQYFQGEKCEEHARAQLAKTMDAMLETTLTLPMLSDIAYDIGDLREYVGINFGEIRSAVSELEATFKKAFDDLSRKLTTNFQWTHLVQSYSSVIKNIGYYSYRLEDLPKRYPTTLDLERSKLATAVLEADGIEKWLYEINYLFNGRSGAPLVNHEPLMLLFMDKHQGLACSPVYKAAVDNTWRQLVLFQQMGFMVWAQALEIKGRPTEHISTLYTDRTTKQVSIFQQRTCEYSIVDSVNVQCSGGRYLHPSLEIINKCKTNYYLTGNKKTTCIKKNSQCFACNCNAANSNSMQCSDQSGQCNCKAGFYGKQCQNRDCVWKTWSSYSQCSRHCDYGGTMTKTRPQVTKQGQGKACTGSDRHTTSCFKGCCWNQFHCSNQQRCIASSQKCNYNNDCGDNEDENSCKEHCTTHYTPWNAHGGGDVVYLDRHKLNCGGNGHVFKMFHLERYGKYIRYKYTCCKLNSIVCVNTWKQNYFSYDGGDDTAYLDRQVVTCGRYGYLNSLWLNRNSHHNLVRYSYHCCYLRHQSHRTRTSCYTSYTAFTDDGDGKSFYLDRQTVECRDRYFLSYFHLVRNSGHSHWRYKYQCCQIIS